MDRFSFTAVDPDGATRSGVIEARDRAAAVEALSAAGRTPIRLDPERAAGVTAAGGGGARPLPEEALAEIARGLGLLLRAGAPLDEALAIQASQARGAAGAALRETLAAVKAGRPVSAALAGRAPGFVIGLVEAGEAGGALAAALTRVADLLDERVQTRARLRSALLYPAAMLGLTALAVAFLAFAVLPQFERLFDGFGQALPWSTEALLAAGAGLRRWWWALLAGLGALALAARAALGTPGGRLAADRALLAAPALGPALRKLETARFARTLALLIEARAPLLGAIQQATRTVGNTAVSAKLGTAATAVREGRRLHEALREAGALPDAAVDMVRVGEESGALAEMLNHVAGINQSEGEKAVARLIGAVTPALTLLLGGLVAALMASIVSAVFSINAIAL